MIPMPPTRARAIASGASVTVSIAALTMGMFRRMRRVRRVVVSTCLGRTAERAGIKATSSNVRPSSISLFSMSEASGLRGNRSSFRISYSAGDGQADPCSRMRLSTALALVGVQHALSETDRFGRHLHQLVVGDELDRLLQRQPAGGNEDQGIFRRRRPDVGQMLFLARVDDEIAGTHVLADDHALVDRLAGPDEQRTP